MISRFIGESGEAKLLDRLGDGKWSYYHDLFQRGEVHVFYGFREDTLMFEAYYQREYGSFIMNINGTYQMHPSDLSLALALYVLEVDSTADQEFLRRLYGNDFDTLQTIAELGPKKAKTFLSAMRKIDDLAYRIGKEQRAELSRKPTLRFYLETERGRLRVSLRLGFTKLYMNRKTGSFLRDYYAGNPISIQKENVVLPPSTFDSQEEDALQYIYNTIAGNYYFNGNSPAVLDEEKSLQFLFLLHGKSVDYNGNPTAISEINPVQMALSEDGTLQSTLPLDTKYLFKSGKRAVVIKPGEIELYEFASASAGEVFSFFASASGIDSSFLAGQMAKKILPLLKEEDLHVDEGFAKKHPILRPHIDFYVGLEENDVLSFRTDFFLGAEKISKDSFVAISAETARRFHGFSTALEQIGCPVEGKLRGEESVMNFIRADLQPLKAYATIYISEELQARHVSGFPDISLRTISGEDWFSVELYASGYSPDELLQIYSAYTKKKKFIRLRNNYILLDEQNAPLRKLSESFQPDLIGAQLPLYQALKLPSLGGDVDERVKGLIHAVGDYSSRELPPLPAPIEKSMRPYQRSGVKFLYNLYDLGLSGILSDDMGLGKTLQSFALFHVIDAKKPILVVCPKSLIYNWMEERNKWSPNLEAYILTGTPKERKTLYAKMKEAKKAVFFVSYDTLRNDLKEVEGVEFSTLLLDEGQYISNINAQKTHAVKEIKADTRFVLTGTPVQNSLMDLWSIFDFLLPGYFPPVNKFKELYGALDFAGEEAKARLMSKIKPFLLGRKKKDVLAELPDKELVTISLGMNHDQVKAYDAYLAKAREELEQGSMRRMNLLAVMTRLRQICITPGLFLEGDFSSAKIEYLLETLVDLKQSGRKAIIFSGFVSALEMIGKQCKEAGINPEYITGDTSAKVRVILAERFNRPDSNIDVMLVSLKAGGTGLNLIGADTVFHLDPWWNLAAERQAEDRAHRIGQTNKVTVFKLVMKNSIEEKMLALQARKGLLIDMTDEASLEGALTEEDYKFLLS
ncbi:MAG: SNF2 helicase associated domain-containing protein [Bacilli bacterium]|nr:SNF2 helicase associated domain-containing protein [Bacilli bacterium]